MFKMRKDPIILLGMHRSGTTLLSEFLSRFGILLGSSLDVHHESVFFKDINDWILQVAHSTWDMPINVQYLLEQPMARRKVENELYEQVNSHRFWLSYVGLKNTFKFYGNSKIMWGWKDPRTTLTWPIWHNLFPQARYIFIYRNGVDVANSLKVREGKRLSAIHNKTLSLRCANIERAFELWEEYNHIFYEYLHEYPNMPLLHICYEKLLEDPKNKIEKIISFLGLNLDKSKISAICEIINMSPRYRFGKDPALLEVYQKVKDSPMMKKFGYDRLEEIMPFKR